jgi:hypothetical protein
MSSVSGMLSRIVSALEEAGGPLHVEEISRRLNSRRNSVAAVISNAINSAKRNPEGYPPMAQRLERVSRGCYGLVEKKPRDLDLTWNEAITLVLEESSVPRHYKDITEEIVSRNLAKKIGATPAMTVAAVLSRNQDGLFVSVERGVYSLAQADEESEDEPVDLEGDEDDDVFVSEDRRRFDLEEEEEEEGEAEDSLLPFLLAYGRYWQRGQIKWASIPKLLGVDHIDQPLKIDFSEQRGIYLLHRGHHTLYVGRATKEGIGKRLYHHTRDRFRARWDSFSWFGLREVDTNGKLKTLQSDINLSSEQLIATLEFLFIEAVEPPLNRKQGDRQDFEIREFLQQEDPDFANDREIKALVEALRNR